MPDAVISGDTDSRFDGVRDAFAENFGRFPELGAAVCVVVNGDVVVDLWGGHVDAPRTQPWQRDSLVNVFSASKGIVALLAHRVAARRELDLDATVASYWPKFGAAGKQAITVLQLLDHSAGLPALREQQPPGTLYDWHAMVAALSRETPWWEPGTTHGYHAVTFGFLVGEVLRRAAGASVGGLVHDELGSLGLDVHIGLAAEHDHRVAELPPTIVPDTAADNPVAQAAADPTSMVGLAFANPPDLVEPGVANTTRWRRAEIPASNGHANARSLAKLYGALADRGRINGQQLLPEAAIPELHREHRRGTDRVLGVVTAFSAGFMLPSELRPFGRGPACFGHTGAGGSLGFCDPDAGIGFGYTPNQTIAAMTGGDPRWPSLIDAVYDSLNGRLV